MGYLLDKDLNREFGIPEQPAGRDYLGGRESRNYSSSLASTQSSSEKSSNGSLRGGIANQDYANAKHGQPEPSSFGFGVFAFGGSEYNLGYVGGMLGVITEYDFKDGTSSGAIGEGWFGKGVFGGAGAISGLDSKGIFGPFGFGGFKLDVFKGLAGLQAGLVGSPSEHWAGIFVEGHVGQQTRGGGAYVRWSRGRNSSGSQ